MAIKENVSSTVIAHGSNLRIRVFTDGERDAYLFFQPAEKEPAAEKRMHLKQESRSKGLRHDEVLQREFWKSINLISSACSVMVAGWDPLFDMEIRRVIGDRCQSPFGPETKYSFIGLERNSNVRKLSTKLAFLEPREGSAFQAKNHGLCALYLERSNTFDNYDPLSALRRQHPGAQWAR